MRGSEFRANQQSARFLNMNDLSYVRRSLLAKQACIGKGSFASVFARSHDSASVSMVTTDQFGYYMLADCLWFQMREEVEAAFSRLIEDHGDVGESRELTAYLVGIERPYPVSTTARRRMIRRWADEFSALGRTSSSRHWSDHLHAYSLEFCEAKAEQENEPYRQVFAVLATFLLNYRGALDIERSNFMCPADGTLVWNDVVFDARTFSKNWH